MSAAATTELTALRRRLSLPKFFDNLDSFAETPEGVAKLRELILDLAVRGKLVEQDENDAPASQIIDRFNARWTPSRGGEKRSRHKPIPSIESDKSLTDIPRGWEKVRLGNILEFEYGQSLPKKVRVDEGDVRVYGSNGQVGHHDTALVNERSIVIGRKGSSGAVNLAMEPFWPIDTTYFVTATDGMDLTYSFYLLRSLKLHELGSSIVPGLNRDDAYAQPVPIPPESEQRRIVSKVDGLMSLCDELESRLQRRVRLRERASRSCLDRLANATRSGERQGASRRSDSTKSNATKPAASALPLTESLSSAWQRLSDHFEVLALRYPRNHRPPPPVHPPTRRPRQPRPPRPQRRTGG